MDSLTPSNGNRHSPVVIRVDSLEGDNSLRATVVQEETPGCFTAFIAGAKALWAAFMSWLSGSSAPAPTLQERPITVQIAQSSSSTVDAVKLTHQQLQQQRQVEQERIRIENLQKREAVRQAVETGYENEVRSLLPQTPPPVLDELVQTNYLAAYGQEKALTLLLNVGYQPQDKKAFFKGLMENGRCEDLAIQFFGQQIPQNKREFVEEFLVSAIEMSRTDLVKTFLENKNGADLNKQDREGDTALLLAARSKNLNLVEALVAAKADITVVNERGESLSSLLAEQEQGYLALMYHLQGSPLQPSALENANLTEEQVKTFSNQKQKDLQQAIPFLLYSVCAQGNLRLARDVIATAGGVKNIPCLRTGELLVVAVRHKHKDLADALVKFHKTNGSKEITQENAKQAFEVAAEENMPSVVEGLLPLLEEDFKRKAEVLQKAIQTKAYEVLLILAKDSSLDKERQAELGKINRHDVNNRKLIFALQGDRVALAADVALDKVEQGAHAAANKVSVFFKSLKEKI